MPRFTFDEADSYGSSGNSGSYFSLKDDRDTARVHLIGNDINDFYGYAVHKVTTGDKDRYVNCLRKHGDPVDDCPFCASGDSEIKKVYAKMFIPLYNIDADEVQIWERGKSFFRDLSSYCTRNPNVVSCVTEIERLGAKGDTSTRYNLIKVDDSDATVEDFQDDVPEVIGTIVLDKTYEDMEYYLDKGDFPDAGRQGATRRGSTSDRRSDSSARRNRGSDEESSGERSTRSGISRRTPRRGRRTEEDDY